MSNEVLFILAQFRLISTGRYDSVTRDRAILGDVRLVTTTKDQSLGFINDLPLMLFGEMHSMIGFDKIRMVM